MFGKSGMINGSMTFDVVFIVAVCIGIRVLLPGNREIAFAILMLSSEMAAASRTERIFLGLLRTAFQNCLPTRPQHLSAQYKARLTAAFCKCFSQATSRSILATPLTDPGLRKPVGNI